MYFSAKLPTVLQMLANCLSAESDSLKKSLIVSQNGNYTLHFADGSNRNDSGAFNKPADEKLMTLDQELSDPDPELFIHDLRSEDNQQLPMALFAYSGYRTIGTSIAENFCDGLLDPAQSTKPYELINKELENVLSSITGKNIRFTLSSGIRVKISLEIDGRILTFSQLPEGLKSLISWLGNLLLRLYTIDWAESRRPTEQPFILLLDDIDIHLHPAWQRKILPTIQPLFPNAQIFIATHSPFVVGSVDEAWVHRLLDNGQCKEAVRSKNSYSYVCILDEIFGISEPFGVETTHDLDQFHTFKQQLLADEPYDKAKFEALLDKFRGQSREIQSIIGMELRQLTRLTNQSFI